MVHRRPVYIYFLNVPSFSSRYFNKIKRTSRLGSLLALSLEILVRIAMCTNCTPLVADLFLFCYERDFMLSLSDINQTDIIEAVNSISRYSDDLLNIDNPYFEQVVGQIYPT